MNKIMMACGWIGVLMCALIAGQNVGATPYDGNLMESSGLFAIAFAILAYTGERNT